MVIDIDSFLDKFEDKVKNDENKSEESFKPKKDDLEFQKEVIEKISNLEKKGLESNDFNILTKIYSELKNFDSSLLNKFFVIEQKGGVSLKELGDKYSKEFKKKLDQNVSLLNKQFDEKFKEFDYFISQNNFSKSFSVLVDLKNLINKYPNYYFNLKKSYLIKYNELENSFYQKLENFINNDLLSFRLEIKKLFLKVNDHLKTKGNRIIIEECLHVLENKFASIDSFVFSNLISEYKIFVKLKTLMYNYLEQEYLNDFNEIKNIIYNLFDKFHKLSLEYDIKGVVLTYDEILFQFNRLPDLFYDEKMKIYTDIVNLYSSIDELIVRNNLNIFLQSYNVSKLIEQIRFFLSNIRKTGKINISVLDKLIENVKQIPDSYYLERKILLSKLNKLKEFVIKKKSSSQIKKELMNKNSSFNKINKISENNISLKKETLKESKESNNKNLNKVNDENNNIKDINNEENSRSQEKVINISSITNEKLKKVLLEINKEYKRILDSKDPKEIKIAYKKLLFYLNLIKLSQSKKEEIKSKVKKAILNKKI